MAPGKTPRRRVHGRPDVADDAQTRAQRHCAEGHLAGRIGVAQRAAERAAVADLPVADEGDGFREQRDPFTDHGRRLQRGVPRQRPDAHHTISRDDAVEPGDPVDIDDRRRPQEPHAQERHQALPAREQPRVTVEPCEGGERLLHRQCREVLERGRLHQRYDFLIVPYHHSSIGDIPAALPGSPDPHQPRPEHVRLSAIGWLRTCGSLRA